MSFKCTSCGLCCRHINTVVIRARQQVAAGSADAMLRELALFPFPWKEDGSCSKLVDNLCSVYADRPDVCSVEKTWEKFHRAGGVPQEGYFKLAEMSCAFLQAKAGLIPSGE